MSEERPVTDPHGDLDRFVDGELQPEEAVRLRAHLAGCQVCQLALDDLLQLEVGTRRAMGSRRSPVTEIFRPRSRAVPLAGVVLAAALAAGLLLTLRPAAPAEDPELWLAGSPTRALEFRLTSGGAARYRPLAVTRGQPTGVAPPPLGELARLERQGGLVTIADAYLLRGQVQAAQPYLDRAAPTPDALSAKAAAYLLLKRPDEALQNADAALRLQPAHGAARWNRALALRALELPLTAAEDLDAVAALGEPGWSDEARAMASKLRAETQRRRDAYQTGVDRCRAAMGGATPFPMEVAGVSKRLARFCFYDVARAAGSTATLEPLLEVARQMDPQYGGGSVLLDGVAKAIAGASPKRPELSQAYARAIRTGAGDDQWVALAAEARAARQPDIELGALYFVSAGRLDIARYQALAAAAHDPWFAALADERGAEVEAQRGQPAQGLERLWSRAKRCESVDRVEDRCLTIEHTVGYLYLMLKQTLDARQTGLTALKWALNDGSWDQENRFLLELGQVARVRADMALMHAYLEEVLAREQDPCSAYAEFVRSNLALAHQQALDFPEARRQVDRLAQCPQPPSKERMFAIADLQRIAPRPGDENLLRRGEEAAREDRSLTPGEQALVTHLLGRARVEHDPVDGERILRKAIVEADAFSGTDRAAGLARLYSYTSLALAAAKRGSFDTALALISEERGWATAPPCSMWFAADDERLMVAARDASGAVRGWYDGARVAPISRGEELAPSELLSVLRSCAEVQVIARPPVGGRPGLMPPEVAWSEVVRRGPVPAVGHGPRLVVWNPTVPASTGRPPLSGAPPMSVGAIWLEGRRATPSAVLAEMRTASLVEVHVHGAAGGEDSDASSLLLAEDRSGRSMLTPDDVRKERLAGHPLVLLAACNSGNANSSIDEIFGLPEAFVEAGARAVLAVTAQVPDQESEAFFRPLLERIRGGASPAVTLRDARLAWHAAHGRSWVDSVVLFE